MHTLAVLADTFSVDEQEEPLLAGRAAVLLGADDAACAVAPQTSAHCQPDQGGGWGKGERDGQPIRVSRSHCFTGILTEHVAPKQMTTFTSFPCN